MRLKTNVYIDGFNLYYGALRKTPYKWLNVEALCNALLTKNDIHRIRYFTAKVDPRPNDLDQPVRQLAYLRALATLPKVDIHYGTFLTKPVTLPTTAPVARGQKPIFAEVLKAEEKGSDVNLASYLLLDAFKGDCQCAVVISNDSDLLTPIRMARYDLGLTVGALLPRTVGSAELKSTVNFWKPIRAVALAASQFPHSVADGHGKITKPPRW